MFEQSLQRLYGSESRSIYNYEINYDPLVIPMYNVNKLGVQMFL